MTTSQASIGSRQVISVIEPGHDLNLRRLRRGGDRLAHAALRAHATERAPILFTRSRRRLRASCAGAPGSPPSFRTSGSRHSADITPRQESAVFTGTGFGSMNRSLKTGNIFRCSSRALFVSPARNAWTSATTSAGNKFEATLTTPTAPTDRNGSVSESSPLRMVNASGNRARNSLTRSTLPLASLIATMFRAIHREPLDGFRSNIHAAAAGNIVKHDRRGRRLRDRLEMPEQTFLARLVVVRRDDQHSIDAHLFRRARRRDRRPPWNSIPSPPAPGNGPSRSQPRSGSPVRVLAAKASAIRPWCRRRSCR